MLNFHIGMLICDLKAKISNETTGYLSLLHSLAFIPYNSSLDFHSVGQYIPLKIPASCTAGVEHDAFLVNNQ